MTIEFPRKLLREKTHSWNLVGVAATPGQTAQSFAPIVRSDGGGYWSCSMTDVSLSGTRKADIKQLTLLWRAIRQICDGGVNSIIVPRNDALFRPWPTGVSQSSGTNIPHSDGSLFSDGVGYYQPTIDIRCAGASLRGTELDVTIHYGGQLQGGESFSINHPTMGWRMYEIATVKRFTDINFRISFMPPLREDVPEDDVRLEFDRPRCMMRLVSTNSMDLSVQPWTFNSASTAFIEAPPPS